MNTHHLETAQEKRLQKQPLIAMPTIRYVVGGIAL